MSEQFDNEFSRKFFISANESNPEGELALNILVSNIIEIATAHANSLGIGNPSMEHLGAGWVLSRLTLEMTHYPKVNTEYTVTTWVESWNRHFSTRDFEILDHEGNSVGFARSIWMVLNTKTHENFGLSHLSLDSSAVSDRDCPIARQAKHRDILPEETPASEVSAAQLIANVPDIDYRFKYNDIDFYRHVNTVRYLTILLNSRPLGFFDSNYVSRLEISFMHEGNFGEEISVRQYVEKSADSELSSYSFYSLAKKMPLLFARMKFEPRD